MIAPLRIVFAGTPEFALPSLRMAARHGQVRQDMHQPAPLADSVRRLREVLAS